MNVINSSCLNAYNFDKELVLGSVKLCQYIDHISIGRSKFRRGKKEKKRKTQPQHPNRAKIFSSNWLRSQNREPSDLSVWMWKFYAEIRVTSTFRKNYTNVFFSRFILDQSFDAGILFFHCLHLALACERLCGSSIAQLTSRSTDDTGKDIELRRPNYF